MNGPGRPPKVLAIASGGGHWVQLRRMRRAWAGCPVVYATTHAGYGREVAEDAVRDGVAPPGFRVVTDANRWQKLRLVRQLLEIAWLLLRERPQVVVSTGAAPGFFALRLGRLMGARTAWIDSIANAEELSLSGRKAAGCADLYLTQWPHLAGCVEEKAGRPAFRGRVI